jgi:hypothetical protein
MAHELQGGPLDGMTVAIGNNTDTAVFFLVRADALGYRVAWYTYDGPQLHGPFCAIEGEPYKFLRSELWSNDRWEREKFNRRALWAPA